MKKFFPVIALTMALMVSCDKEEYTHSIIVSYPAQDQLAFVYADQLTDSIKFMTTDKFTITSNDSWIVIPDETQKGNIAYANRNVWVAGLPVNFLPNTTGESRTGSVTLHTSGDNGWDQSIVAYYYQVTWPNISRPAPAYSYKDRTITGAAFIGELPATPTLPDTLAFTAYGDWTLTDGSFVHPNLTYLTYGKEGKHEVQLNVEPNTTTEKRTDVLVLTSNGVSTEITYKQAAKTEDE